MLFACFARHIRGDEILRALVRERLCHVVEKLALAFHHIIPIDFRICPHGFHSLEQRAEHVDHRIGIGIDKVTHVLPRLNIPLIVFVVEFAVDDGKQANL